ncbi:MAG: mannose-1-phosphate guanylyltransferase/mannose-6-phosphate isomerase [Pseudomonadota bacterium]|nr:mannose-1-phosphate guanylyltransferase/mannose-6-phosphate isomerase [Pseudomonadota bacterium]
MKICPVILSGGSGTRLWPSSRKSLPKQFISFPGTGSLFARTAERATALSNAAAPLVVSSRQQGFLCRQAMDRLGVKARYLLEETGRNTAPAIWFAARASIPDDILLIMPSDHWIEDIDSFSRAVAHGAEICDSGRWVTFGITATDPATGYGYIEVAEAGEEVANVRSFTEKPDLATAASYLEAGNYFWNSGIFMVRADVCLDSFDTHQPELAAAAARCWESRDQRSDEDILLKPDLENVPSIAVDYAIMERQDNIALIPFDGGWSDVGSWDSLSKLMAENATGTGGDAVLVESQNVFVHGNGRTIAGIGLEDLIIIDDDDATLIVRKGQTEHVKTVIDQLMTANNAVATQHSFEYRPWGMFENLLDSDACKVKRLTVDPGQHLSLQYHHRRSEHWVVVQGTATVQLDGERLTLEAGHSIDIPLGAHHALGNDTDQPVIVIEVQMGSYFGEDDIVRVSDPYNR